MATTFPDRTLLVGGSLAAFAAAALLNPFQASSPPSAGMCAITLEQFARITPEMHRVEVDAIIGCRGREVGRSTDVSRPGHMLTHVEYERVNRTPAVLVFSGERLVSKRYSAGGL
jgi:hypothetical protein